jgi:hypothetical protein
MKSRKIELKLHRLILLGAIAAFSGSAWAVENGCSYAASGTGIGGTGMVARSTGIGGTGAIAGKVILSQGSAEAQSNGRKRLLAKGDPVCVGETIVTSRSGAVEIRMTDEGLVSVRPETQLKIEQFAYAGSSRDISIISLLRGAGRFVTGKLGKLYPQNDLIKTPTATIGVRGTDHEAMVILPGDSSSYRSGTYDKVNQGITFIRTDRGEIDIHPNQVGLAVDTEEMPVLLKNIPEFYGHGASLKEGGGAFEAGKNEGGLGEGKGEAQSREHSGAGAELANPHENRATSREIPENPALDSHESASHPERPESPSHPELPETPNMPELPESPTLPELPESPTESH